MPRSSRCKNPSKSSNDDAKLSVKSQEFRTLFQDLDRFDKMLISNSNEVSRQIINAPERGVFYFNQKDLKQSSPQQMAYRFSMNLSQKQSLWPNQNTQKEQSQQQIAEISKIKSENVKSPIEAGFRQINTSKKQSHMSQQKIEIVQHILTQFQPQCDAQIFKRLPESENIMKEDKE